MHVRFICLISAHQSYNINSCYMYLWVFTKNVMKCLHHIVWHNQDWFCKHCILFSQCWSIAHLHKLSNPKMIWNSYVVNFSLIYYVTSRTLNHTSHRSVWLKHNKYMKFKTMPCAYLLLEKGLVLFKTNFC